MYKNNSVERALFRWQKWHNSIMNYWIEYCYELNRDFISVEFIASKKMEELKLPDLILLKLYWISCLFSDYNFDYPNTFENIIKPNGLQIKGDYIKPNVRVYPPSVMTDNDIKFEARQYGFSIEEIKQMFFSSSYSYVMHLQSDHELFVILKEQRGRPGRSRKLGRPPLYSDRLAIQCAMLRDNYDMKNVQIADRFKLRKTKPYFSWQSDVVVNLIRRGRKLVKEISDIT